ncbi:protein phosphatase 1 regulatory subunit 15B [Centropristis striata]|uniref:protein phosphatase 1 regulatory subunit 15B n=1 Tax=Centropristis striata TaxID=184440 RepID=UPI0027E1F129|nr:protein phosphatase 1 regulatory subunit 15B [Centropristis striata]
MFSSLSGEGSSSPAGRGASSPGLAGQESSWIGLLPRPGLSFLQRYLPVRLRAAAARTDTGWGFKTSFVDEEREFLRQLDDMMPLQQNPAPQLAYLRCEPDGAAGGSPWLTAQSLRDMELNLCQQTRVGYLSSVRTFFSHVLLSAVSSQPAAGPDWDPAGPSVHGSGGKARPWWGSFWGGEESSQRGLLSFLSWAEEDSITARLCPQQPGTKAPETTAAFGGRRWTLEHTGPADHKEEPANKGGLHTVQKTEGSTADPRLNEMALLTPDQDNGYSSLEEEHFQLKAPNQDQPPQEAESAEPAAAETPEMEEEEGDSQSDEEGPEVGPSAEVTTPQCQNRAIAFIMGCPCSDDSSQSESSDDDDDDDDDGFDSEGSSDLTESSDEDDGASDGEADSEADRLWNSLCHSGDPYNPRNFTARLNSAASPPRSIPASTPPSSTGSSPASSPDLTLLPLAASLHLVSSSPPSSSETWDDSTSASEADEAESLRLWSSFSCSSDPYSPFNFQAPLRSQEPAEVPPQTRTRKSPRSPRHDPASPPEYRKEEAEERLDSGFSEPSTSSSSTQSCCKKVRFCDEVEEFFTSGGEEEEDRRGPWEELARDRCRFLRRVQETEQSISYVLTPQHRRRVARRLAARTRVLEP